VVTHCLNNTIDVGFTQDHEAGDLTDARKEDNLRELESLPQIQLAYARPVFFEVCADSEYIHGVQVAIKMFPPNDYQFALEDPDLVKEIESLNLLADGNN